MAILCFLGLAMHICQAGEIICPKTLEVTERPAAAIDGWEVAGTARTVRLENAQVFDGHADEMASLVPDASRIGKGTYTAIWKLAADRERDTWIGCSYAGSALLLVRKVERSAARCELTYVLKGKSSPGRLLRVDCG